MKLFVLLAVLFAATTNILFAQSNDPCSSHPLFTSLSNFTIKGCDTKEFEKLDIRQADKTKGAVTVEKTGEYLKVAYAFGGEFEKRPSNTQIYQNYATAITRAGGEVLLNGDNGVYGKVKKGGDTWWVKVYTDGSSWYWVETIKEAAMRQDVALTAAEIKTALAAEGKIPVYGIYFDTDKAIVKQESTPSLTAIAEFLKANTATTVFIVGHTDNTGDFNHNIQLSKDRATAIVNELSGKFGVNKNQLIPQGVGPLAPVASNTVEEGKAKNRRVEIVKK